MKLSLNIILLLFVCFEWHTAKSQTTNISGIINNYAAVTAISTNACQTIISLNSATGFNIGDSVMIIQMKGASIDSISTTSVFGNVLNMQSAGRYEIFTIAAITGNQITFNGSFINTYSMNGKVQLVRIPVYNNAIVTGLLTCSPWDGQTGGVLAFFVNNTLTLNNDIDVTGKGFRGGDISNNPDGSCGGTSSAFFYNLYQPGTSWIQGGAMKGEGIAEVSTLRMAGKGHLANGGGGGNKHNTGGGGGANYTSGGKGGNELGGCAVNGNGGLGGEAIAYASSGYSILVPGGGGGCGDYNNNVGSDGTNGGGIILIKANSIVGNNFTINNNGSDNLVLAGGISDGAGGGGAGGSTIIHTQNFIGNINIKAKGGHGGDQGPGSFYGCAGPGGGGGTGIIMVNMPTLLANVNTTVTPGTSGMIQNPAFTCYNTSYGATNGSVASIAYIPNVNLIYSIPSVTSIPVNLGNDTVLCPGQTFVLSAGIYSSYSWQDFSTNSTYVVTSPGTYSVTVTDGSGCTSSDIIIVNGNSNVVNLGNDTLLCSGQTLVLNAGIFSSYIWQDLSTNATYLVSSAGTYSVNVTDSWGCTSSDVIQVFGGNNPVNLGNDTLLCPGQNFVLNAGLYTSYSWQDLSTNASFLVMSPGTYSVTVTDNFGCTSSDIIQVNGINNAVNLGNDTTLCEGDIISLNAPILSGASYLWQDNSINNSFTVSNAGIYWVEISISNCKASDTIQINYNPLPTINLGNDTLICSEEFIILDATTTNASYLWQNNSSAATQMATPTNTYWVDISVNNCHARDTIFVGLKDSNCYCNLFIPNAFSPNNDLNNDVLKLLNTNDIDLKYFSIYNRWGQIVFETKAPHEVWNGYFKNSPCEIGTYFYQIKYHCNINHKDYFLKGDITLIR